MTVKPETQILRCDLGAASLSWGLPDIRIRLLWRTFRRDCNPGNRGWGHPFGLPASPNVDQQRRLTRPARLGRWAALIPSAIEFRGHGGVDGVYAACCWFDRCSAVIAAVVVDRGCQPCSRQPDT